MVTSIVVAAVTWSTTTTTISALRGPMTELMAFPALVVGAGTGTTRSLTTLINFGLWLFNGQAVSLEVHSISRLDGGLCSLVIFEFDESVAILHHDIQNCTVLSIQVPDVAIVDVSADAANVHLHWGCLVAVISAFTRG